MTHPFRLSERVQFVSPAKLRANPRNLEVHGDFDPKGRDAWIVDDVAKNGILLPIILKPDGETIEDGHRRVWAAEQCGLKTVPHVVLEAGEGQAFMSAQLARELSMHAKCVLYKDRIAALVESGNKRKAQNFPRVHQKCNDALLVDADSNGIEEPKDEHEEAWIELEQVLGKPRKRLAQGVALLVKIDEWKASPDAKLGRKASMVSSVFRNRGLAPALRLADESEQAGEDRDDDDIPGKESWPALDKRKRGGGKKGRQPKEVALPNDPNDSAPPITDSDRWVFVLAHAMYQFPSWVVKVPHHEMFNFLECVDAAILQERDNAQA